VALTLCALGVHLGLLSLGSAARAAGPEPPDWDRPPPRAVDSTLPPAARGFQAALRSGLQLPWGEVSDADGDEISARYGWQVPIVIDAGFKLSKPWFIGAYAGAGYGSIGSGNVAEEACAAPGVTCSTLSYQVGVQLQYHLGPSDRLNPWLGVGGGYEWFRQELSASDYREEQETSGVALLKVLLGLDYRYRELFGFGPVIEMSFGRFQATRTLVDGERTHEGPVEQGAWHGFLTLGGRLVVLP
jgi:hypothetical protein